MKHVGRIIKSRKKCVVAYRVLPNDPEHCLVVLTENLMADEHDALIRAVLKYKKHYQNNQFSQRLENLMSSVSSKKLDRITLSSSEGMVFLRLEQIIRLESDGNYTSFFTSNDKIVVSKTIKEYEGILPEDVFCRIHQSHIVNTNFISKFLKEDGGHALMEDGSKLPVSRRRKEALLQLLSGKSL